jgi:hypothetical protein
MAVFCLEIRSRYLAEETKVSLETPKNRQPAGRESNLGPLVYEA